MLTEGVSLGITQGRQHLSNRAAIDAAADTADFDSHRILGRPTLRRETDLDPLRLQIDFCTCYAHEGRSGFATDIDGTFVGGREFSAGRKLLDAEMGMPIVFTDIGGVEPFVSAGLSDDLTQTDIDLVNGTFTSGDRLGGRAGVSLRFDIRDDVARKALSRYESIGRSDEYLGRPTQNTIGLSNGGGRACSRLHCDFPKSRLILSCVI